MSNSKYKLQTMESVALDVQFRWTLGLLAKYLKITKKSLRKAKKILDAPEFKDLVKVKKKLVNMTFNFGYFSYYKVIKKKRRHILAPHPALQEVLWVISQKIVELSPAHERAYGFVQKRNFQMATESLVGNKHFFSFDISDAFPSITDKMIEKRLLQLNVPEEFIKILVRLVTHQYNGEYRLPQGASSSPVILNLVYYPMCEEIESVCQNWEIDWCVYADDFTFAGKDVTNEMKKTLLAIPKKYGFKIKKKKTKDNLGKTIPHMLGLIIVDGKVHLKRYTKKKFRQRFYFAWKHGLYNDWLVDGTANVIRQVYGDPEDWPGSLRKYWVLCMNKRCGKILEKEPIKLIRKETKEETYEEIFNKNRSFA